MRSDYCYPFILVVLLWSFRHHYSGTASLWKEYPSIDGSLPKPPSLIRLVGTLMTAGKTTKGSSLMVQREPKQRIDRSPPTEAQFLQDEGIENYWKDA